MNKTAMVCLSNRNTASNIRALAVSLQTLKIKDHRFIISQYFQIILSLCLMPTPLKSLVFIQMLRLDTTPQQPGTCGAIWWSSSPKQGILGQESVERSSSERSPKMFWLNCLRSMRWTKSERSMV